MEEKMKVGMIMCLSLSVAMLWSGFVYAADLEVDKEEFNEKWQEAYKELQEIDPAAAEEFRALTVEEFQNGTIGYTPEVTRDVGPVPGPRPGPIGTPPPTPRPGPGPGPLIPDAHGTASLKDQDEYLKVYPCLPQCQALGLVVLLSTQKILK